MRLKRIGTVRSTRSPGNSHPAASVGGLVSGRARWASSTSVRSPNPSFFQPSRGIVGDPIECVGLSLEASDVFLLSIRVGAHHMPLRPKLDGLGSERDFARGFGHSANMRPIPEVCQPRSRPLWPDLNFAVAGFDKLGLEAKVPRTREHFRQGGSYGYIRRARQKQKHNDRRSSGGGNPRDHLPLRIGPFARNHIHPSFHRGRLSWQRHPNKPSTSVRGTSELRRLIRSPRRPRPGTRTQKRVGSEENVEAHVSKPFRTKSTRRKTKARWGEHLYPFRRFRLNG